LSEPDAQGPRAWSSYFNYFTEIEEHFQKARGSSLFLLSPLDWALIEAWKNSGVPLEAVLRGIDAAFEKWRARRSRTQMVNSLAFCSQAVMTEAQRMADAGAQPTRERSEEPAFPAEALRAFVDGNAQAIRATCVAEFEAVAVALDQIAAELTELAKDPEQLEQRLTVLEQKLLALARGRQSDEQALELRERLNAQVRPYRSKMTAPQIAMLEAQFLERALLENAGLPRLSLFYMG
jgi:hypothetical protein